MSVTDTGLPRLKFRMLRAQFRASWRLFPETQEPGEKMDKRPLAIVMLSPSEQGHGIALVRLNTDGSVNPGRNFLLTYRPTQGAQKSYAIALADMLGCEVLDLSK